MSLRRSLPLLSGLLLMPTIAAAQEPAQLTITVRDTAGEPVTGARVEVGGVRGRRITGAGGVARVGRVAPGNRIVTVSRIGYALQRMAVELTPGARVDTVVVLTPEAVEVAGVAGRAAARDPALDARGFYDRQARGAGAFMTYERIEELNPGRTVDLFRHLRGFRVSYDRGRGEYYVKTNRGAGNMSMDCDAPQVYLDGVMISQNAHYFNFIDPHQVAAIEAFSSASQIPVEYRMTGSACGVVLVWTRTGNER